MPVLTTPGRIVESLRFFAFRADEGNVAFRSPWHLAYERLIVWNVAIGGLAMGVALLAVSPAGFDASDIVGWLALGVGTASGCALVLGRGRPVPFLITIMVLVGAVAPIVDVSLAMALNTIVVSVLATGALLVRSLPRFWAFVALALAAMAARLVLAFLGVQTVLAVSLPPTVPWMVATTSIVTTAISFRGLRDQLIRKDQHRTEMNHLISSLAHNLRTPLTGVIGFGHLVESEVLTAAGQEYAHRVVSHGWELSSCLDDLIIAARSNADGLEMLRRPVDLGQAVDQILSSVPGARDKLSYCSVRGEAIGDPTRVNHVIRHLVSNAVEHGGQNVIIHSRGRGREVTLYVNDDGPVLSDEVMSRAFEPFYHRSDNEELLGRGIGLTVSRILAQAMGGDVRLDNDHTGTTAALRLPASFDYSIPTSDTLSIFQRTHRNLWRSVSRDNP